MTAQTFTFDFEPRYQRAARLFRITPQTTSIRIEDGSLLIKFGPWRAVTFLSNITDVSASGPFSFVKTAGPAHLSAADRGLTFATNSHTGVCIQFAQRITGIDGVGLIKHPNLTVTPSEPDRFIAALGHDPK